jgi:hypothetical protein
MNPPAATWLIRAGWRATPRAPQQRVTETEKQGGEEPVLTRHRRVHRHAAEVRARAHAKGASEMAATTMPNSLLVGE